MMAFTTSNMFSMTVFSRSQRDKNETNEKKSSFVDSLVIKQPDSCICFSVIKINGHLRKRALNLRAVFDPW